MTRGGVTRATTSAILRAVWAMICVRGDLSAKNGRADVAIVDGLIGLMRSEGS